MLHIKAFCHSSPSVCHAHAGHFLARLHSRRLCELWEFYFPLTVALFGTAAATAYYLLTATTHLAQWLPAVGLIVKVQEVLTFLTGCLLQLAPSPANCIAFPEHPFALLTASAVLTYYIAAGILLAERGFSLSPNALHTPTTYQANTGKLAHHQPDIDLTLL